MNRADPMECTDAKLLIPSYLDGELSEAQAAPLRKHLLDCQPCRASAQGEKNLKLWFVAQAAPAVPKGFAARVARRAFAGDTGERSLAGAELAIAAPVRKDADSLRFVLQLTSIAAVLLIFLSIAVRQQTLPSGGKLMADDHPEIKFERALEELDQLNRADAPAQRQLAAPERQRAAAQPAGQRLDQPSAAGSNQNRAGEPKQ